MPYPVQPGRFDHLILALVERGVRAYVEPHARFPLWENGLGKLVEVAIERSALPKGPVQSVRIGNVDVPLDVLRGLCMAMRLLPDGEVPRVGT